MWSKEVVRYSPLTEQTRRTRPHSCQNMDREDVEANLGDRGVMWGNNGL